MPPEPAQNLRLIETADGSCTLQNAALTETYHSRFGAITESVDVFIKNSGVGDRLENGHPTRVLEIGFGAGLNFILTAGRADQHRSPLYYEALEFALPPVPLLIELLQRNTPDHQALIDDLQQSLRSTTTNDILNIGQYSQLNLRQENAFEATFDQCIFDAVYLDAFSSKNNPDLWSTEFLHRLHQTLKRNGILATYSVNRAFRDSLTDAGFLWEKRKGPPGKREVVIAYPK